MTAYEEYLKTFDARAVRAACVEWIRGWFQTNGMDCKAVVGISGGKDSSVVAALCAEALGRDRVLGVLMPNGEQPDIGDSEMLCEHLGINYFTVNIHDAVEAVKSSVGAGLGIGAGLLSSQTTVNLPARIRMATLYAVAQTVGGRVANTCNLSEDWVGYSTRYGDSAGDFSPLANLTTDEVITIGEALGLPDALVHKTPSDGLCGRSDEDNLGFTYRALNEYIRTGKYADREFASHIDMIHEKNLFKLLPMPAFPYKPDTTGGQ